MRYAINSLSNDAQDPHSLLNTKGVKRKAELVEIIENCETTIQEVQTMIDKHSSLKSDRGKFVRVWHAYKIGSSDLDSLRGKLTFYTSIIIMFLLSLEGSAVARIERKVDRVYARMLQDDAGQAQQSSISVASTSSLLSHIDTNEDDVWTILKTELLAEDISMAHIMSNKEDIIGYIKYLIAKGIPNGTFEGNPGHIYGGITTSSASSASKPVVYDHVRIQGPSIAEEYDSRRQRERQEWIRVEEREARDGSERVAIRERLAQIRETEEQSESMEQSERQGSEKARPMQRLTVDQEARYQQEERGREHVAIPQRRVGRRRQRLEEQAGIPQTREDPERLRAHHGEPSSPSELQLIVKKAKERREANEAGFRMMLQEFKTNSASRFRGGPYVHLQR